MRGTGGVVESEWRSYIRAAMRVPDFILFASDATLVGLFGGALLLVALLALFAEHRRVRRKSADAVGFMPWTLVFLASAVSGSGLMIIAIKGWLGG